MPFSTDGADRHAAAARIEGAPAGKKEGAAAYIERERLAVVNLGPSGWLLYQFQQRRLRRIPPAHPVVLTSRYSAHPLLCRPRSSDLDVFYQIFVAREFACLDDLPEPALIIDCGAYVGYASAYLLSRFPRSELIAVEPDPENYRLLTRNLAPFGRRASTLRAALWSHPADLKISEATYRDGREWSRQVRACAPGEPGDLSAVDVAGLLRQSGRDRIAILKIDIEGAEAVVFSENYREWIDRVDVLAIELHDDTAFGDARGVFARAIEGRGFVTGRSGELTICRAARRDGRAP